MRLKMWTDDHVYVIAESAEQAMRVFEVQQLGSNYCAELDDIANWRLVDGNDVLEYVFREFQTVLHLPPDATVTKPPDTWLAVSAPARSWCECINRPLLFMYVEDRSNDEAW